MGMDVYGKNPTNENGEYFRASIWSWPVIHQMMETACRDLLSKELLKAMEYNDGAGPDDQATCNEIADRLEVVVSAADDSLVPETGNMQFNSIEEVTSAVTGGEHVNRVQFAYTTKKSLLKEWIEFLRHCGGFSVL